MSVHVYRLAVTYPEGSLRPDGYPDREWEPEGWEPESYQVADGSYESDYFRWPANRLCLSLGTAKRRAGLFRKYGATVEIERSVSVEWPAPDVTP